MRAQFEPVLAALLTHIEAKVGVKFQAVGRRVLPWSQVNDQPALFLRQTGITDEYDGSLPIYTIEAELWIYAKAVEDQDCAPGIALNEIVAAVRRCFYPDEIGSERFTLGGIAYWCRIEGKSEYAPGDTIAQSIALLPVRITLTDEVAWNT